MNRLGVIIGLLFVVLYSEGAMSSDDYPVEDTTVVNERIRAHTHAFQGSAIPTVHANYLAARRIHRSLQQGRVHGVTAASERLLREQLLDGFDVDAISRAASSELDSELRRRLAAGDTDTYSLAAVFGSIDEVQRQAVADRYTAAIQTLDATSRGVIEAKVAADIADSTVTTLDYAALGVDVPNYVRMLMERYAAGPSPAERAYVNAQSSTSSASATFRIQSQ